MVTITTRTAQQGDKVIARDGSGDWEGTLVARSADGWCYTRITKAPVGMLQWVGNVIDFPPGEVRSILSA